MKDKLNRLGAILNELQMDEYLNEDSLPKIGEARGLVNELVKNCSIPVVVNCNHDFQRVERGGEFEGNQCHCGEWENLT